MLSKWQGWKPPGRPYRNCDITAGHVPQFTATPSPTTTPTASQPSAAPTSTPTPESQANFHNLDGSFCSSEGITLDGINDYISITPAFTLSNAHTIAIRLKLVAVPTRVFVFDFNEGCGNGYFVQTEPNLQLTQKIDNCNDLTKSSFW